MKLFAPLGIILVGSLVTLSSISYRLLLFQLLWILVGTVIAFIFAKIDWQSLFNYQWFVGGIYGVAILLLTLTYFIAPVIRNTRSWLVVGPLSFQPVELAKIGLILAYARYFSRRHLMIARWKTIFASCALFAIPAVLTAVQPDLGSTMVLFGIWFGFLLLSGLPWKRIVVALVIFALLGFLGWHSVLKDYQKARIRGVFYPQENVLGVNYSAIQSKIAIGSAGLWGKGYDQGSQAQLGFLTEPATDFILAAFIEEWGIVPGLVLIGAFLALTLQILKVGIAADQNFEKFICLGTAVVFGIHFLLNAGSVVGFVPVVGVTFPFLSYGGSSLLTDFFLLSVVHAIAKRSYA